MHRKLGHKEDYPRLLRGDAAPAGPGGPGLPKEQDERRKCDARGRLWCGTMGYEKSPGEPVSSQGTLYCYHGGTPSPILMGFD